MTRRQTRLAYEVKVRALIQADVSLATRETYGAQRRFLDGHRVLNPDDPVGKWTVSEKESPTWLRGVSGWSSFYKPHTIDAAERLLRGLHAAGIILASETAWLGHPFPNGICWVQLADGKDSFAQRTAKNTYGELRDNAKHGYFAFLGNRLGQDGAKFSTSCESQVEHHEPYVVAIEDQWLKKLAKRTNAFFQMRKAGEGYE